MTKRLLLVAAVMALSSNVCGQAPPDSNQASVQVPFPSNAPSRESVVHFLDVIKAKRAMQIMFDGASVAGREAARKTFVKQMPNATEEQLKILDSIWSDMFKSFDLDELIGLVADVYRRHLTQSDIDGMTAFFESPVGQKYLSEQPAMLQESMKAGSDYANKQMVDIQNKMNQKVKELMETLQKSNSDLTKPPISSGEKPPSPRVS